MSDKTKGEKVMNEKLDKELVDEELDSEEFNEKEFDDEEFEDEKDRSEVVKIQYWSGLMYCGGCEDGGVLSMHVTEKEKALLDSAKQLSCGQFTDFLEKSCPRLLQRLHDAAGHKVNVQMAEDAMCDFNFDDEEFEDYSYEDKIDYIIDQMNGSIDDICDFTYEYVVD